MAKKIFGLQSVELGPVESDGGMSQSLTQVGETVSSTAQLTTDDNQTQDFTIEESDSPIESVVTQFGKIAFAWSTYQIDSDTLVRFFGGTKTPYSAGPPEVFEQWDAPDNFPDLELSVKITDKKGNVIKIPRAKISGKFGVSFAKDKLGQMDLSATVLQPTKAGVKRLSMIFAK